MVEIGNTVVSFDLFDNFFCCDLNICKGKCCIEGDSGAPLEHEEISQIEKILPKITHLLSAKALAVIKKQGISYVDEDGDTVTSLVDNKECVFTCFENGICFCAIEKAYNQKLIDFPKPISCHLYPIRLEEYETFTAINVHHWSCCREAEVCGKKKNLALYKFVKNPLIRRFSEYWYKELELAAKDYFSENPNRDKN